MKLKLSILSVVALLIAGCASRDIASNADLDIYIKKPAFTISSTIFDCSEVAPITDGKVQEIFNKFNVPVTMTPRVQYYLKYFAETNRDTMQRWLDRSNKYMYIVRDIFQREGVPLDLVALSFTESGFNPHATSRAGAVGMWQFMPSTGRMYGLESDSWVDERQDFEKSTVAAANHLKDLYARFGDWYLALAAYNAGSGRISSATRRHNSKDFFTIASKRTLKLETRDYVPKYMAHLMIYKNMAQYGFTLPAEMPLLYDEITLSTPVNLYALAQEANYAIAQLKELNPELRTPMTPPVDSYTLRIPIGTKDRVVAVMNNRNIDLARYHIYIAEQGENLEQIAIDNGVDLDDLKRLNNLSNNSLYSSKLLFIPNSQRYSAIDDAFAADIAKLAPRYYTVRKGDNFTTISKKHNMSLTALTRLNPKINPRKIYPGQVIVVSVGS
ncbi:MAG: transglycosylase SLT domain-containing protein [Deferribacteraceae bacterium]|jgi:membrane-bound lytic murein transglycosylase D|nr:transglycosylase SLT domain-containing protein [Deferribacteraceae bacterium]